MTTILIEERTLLWIGTMFYSIGFGYVLFSLKRRRSHSRLAVLLLAVVGFCFQTSGLYLRGLEVKSCPVGNVFEIIQFITWSVVLLYLAVGPAFRISLLGFFSVGMAAILGNLSLSITTWDRPYERSIFGDNPWIEAHASSAMFSYGVFAVLALTSAMYLLQNYGLKGKKYTAVYSVLPSIVQLAQINRRLLMTGVFVLTFSLIVGAYYWVGDWEQVRIPKLLISLIIWLAYTLALVLNLSNKLLSRKFAWSCLTIFALALFSIWPVDASRPSDRDTELHGND